jgi:hypothetical protein
MAFSEPNSRENDVAMQHVVGGLLAVGPTYLAHSTAASAVSAAALLLRTSVKPSRLSTSSFILLSAAEQAV